MVTQLTRLRSPEFIKIAAAERELKTWAAWLSFAAPQRFQRKHNLAGLPPQHVFVAAETIQRDKSLALFGRGVAAFGSSVVGYQERTNQR
jgi:hypothetical protein